METCEESRRAFRHGNRCRRPGPSRQADPEADVGRRRALHPEFTKSGRKIPALATSDGNVLGCFWKKNVAKNPTFKLYTVSTQNDHARLAIQWAVALATGGKKPASTHFPSLVFENSTTGKPNPVQCKPAMPGDIYLSAQLSGAAQTKLVKK